MIGLVKDNFVYIKVPKNGCSTYGHILKEHGWLEINLFENNLDLHQMTLWGHLTNPEVRHTKGVEQFLSNNADIDYTNPVISKLLVSGVFDEHTFSLTMMLGKIMAVPIYWIPLDIGIYNYPAGKEMTGDELTADFFREQGIDIDIRKYKKLNVKNHLQDVIKIREYISDCKVRYNKNYQKLVKNFLEPDILLYNRTVEKFRKKYE